MSDIPSKSKLDEYVKLGLLRSQEHATLPLTIYVYTEMTAFERLWNNVTMASRGLVVDDKGRCVVRCIPKFFNEDEPHALCGMVETSTPRYYNKLDGSLIQVVNDDQYGLIVTSKGSFGSTQAMWARQIIDESYSVKDFKPGLTYVFELIHPQNRIVLDYGATRKLFLLAVIETATGNEPWSIYGPWFDAFDRVETVTDIDRHMNGTNIVEGMVVKTGQHRYKVKTGEYIRLHRIVTEFTDKRVWEALRDGQNLEFKNMPEEFQKWLDDTIAAFQGSYNAIAQAVQHEYMLADGLTDKEIGLSTGFKYKSLIFTLRNGRKIDQAIWKMIKPKKEKSK